MAEELQIRAFDQEEREQVLDYDFLPCPKSVFRLLIIAGSMSGKTTCLANMLCRFGYREFYGENIFIVAPTLRDDQVWRRCVGELQLPDTHQYTQFDPSIIKQISKYSAKQQNGALLVLDDLITDRGAFNSRRSDGIINTLFCSGRHKKMSVVVVSQIVKGCPPILRANFSHLISFNLANSYERSVLRREMLSDIPDIEAKFDYATSKKYGFLYVDKKNKAAYRNFEQRLDDEEVPEAEDSNDDERISLPDYIEDDDEHTQQTSDRYRGQDAGPPPDH